MIQQLPIVTTIDVLQNKIIAMKKKVVSKPYIKTPAIKMSKQRTEILGNMQYVEAMKHMRKMNDYQRERKVYVPPLDPQCTFAPVSYTASYRALIKSKTACAKKAEDRLMEWGDKKQKKHIQKVLSNSLQIQSTVTTQLKKKTNRNNDLANSFTKALEFTQQANTTNLRSSEHKELSKKQTSQTTLFSTGRASLSPIQKRD